MLNEGMHSSVTLPLNVRDNCVGVVFFSSDSKEAYTTEHTSFLKTIALSLAAAFDQSFLNDQLIVSTIEGFSKLVESKDSETGNHIERMQRYAVMLVEMAAAKDAFPNQINEAFIKQIEAFSPLHDIGKVSIPDHILMKPGKLTPQEFELMKEHTSIGADILEKMNASVTGVNRSFYKVGIEIVRYHHEKYNGTGYPDGLSGEDIPLSARIVAVADVLDAITSKRPYKNAFGMETSKRIMLEGRNQHFDPVLIDILMENWKRFERQIDVFKEEALESEFHLIS
jgi:response regulator RpfG family c-di-GMP phosphodiesterase